MTSLLDVNVLVALAWPNHVHHRIARDWFAGHHSEGWATCSSTENGFVRISSNRTVVDEARTPVEAILLLRELRQISGHAFWTDDVSVARLGIDELDRIHGHRQVTDAHLVALARRHRGRLVTFDRRVAGLLADSAERERCLFVLT